MRLGLAASAVAFIATSLTWSPLRAAEAASAAPAAAPAAAAPAPTCGLRRVGQLDMTAIADGRFTVPLTLGERASTFMFDTGSGFRSVVPATVTSLGLQAVSGGEVVKDLPGRENIQNVVIPNVSIAGIKMPQVGFLVTPPRKGAENLPGIDGHAGLDMLSAFDLEMDFYEKKLGLFLQNHCPGQVVSWPTTAIVIVPFVFDSSNRINIPIKLDDVVMEAVLDTGVIDTTLDLDIAKESGANIPTDGMKKTGERDGRDAYERRYKLLAFDDIGVANPAITILQNKGGKKTAKTDTTGILAPITVGITTLKKLHIFVSISEQRLYITPGGPPPAGAAPAAVPAPAAAN